MYIGYQYQYGVCNWIIIGVATIGDKIRDTRLRGLGHVQRRFGTVPVQKSLTIKVDGPQRAGVGQKRMWMEVVKIGMKCNLSEDLAEDRSEWRNRICGADPDIVGTRL